MSASPRFWQKLGLGRQNKPSDQQDRASLNSSHSTLSLHDAATKQSKRFSSISLRHRTSSVSIRPQATPAPPIPANINDNSHNRRSRKLSVATISGDSYSYMKSNEKFTPDQPKLYTAEPTSFYRDNDISKKDRHFSKRLSSESMHNLNYQSKNSRIQQRPRESVQEPARRTPSMDKIPRIKPSKSSQSLASVGSSGRVSNEYTPKSKLRPPAKVTRSNSNSSVKSTDKVTKRKSLSKLEKPPSLPDNDPNLLCPQRLARSSSNGSGSATSSGTSASTSEKRRRMADKKLREASAEQESAIEQLQEDLEREKLSVRTLQGQKEAIAKDLDYFCQLVDEVTEEKDQYKKKYEEEKMKNERFQKQLGPSQRETTGTGMASQLEFELQAVQQQATEDHYNFYSNLQCKNDEISRLKNDLKKSQRQIQVLRNTMEQMLKADGKSFDDDSDTIQTRSSYEDSVTSENESKHLLLQTAFQPERHSTNPPSPTPCSVNDDAEDKTGYDFLNNDYGSKKKPESFNKKALISRMRKDQLEEMLGEVDSQLYRVRQQVRRPS